MCRETFPSSDKQMVEKIGFFLSVLSGMSSLVTTYVYSLPVKAIASTEKILMQLLSFDSLLSDFCLTVKPRLLTSATLQLSIGTFDHCHVQGVQCDDMLHTSNTQFQFGLLYNIFPNILIL